MQLQSHQLHMRVQNKVLGWLNLVTCSPIQVFLTFSFRQKITFPPLSLLPCVNCVHNAMRYKTDRSGLVSYSYFAYYPRFGFVFQ